MNDVVILGVGMTVFGKFLNRSAKDLAREAVNNACADAGISKEQIQAAYVGNAVQGLITGQETIRGQVVLRAMGIGDISVINIDNACASGSSALHVGWLDVSSGLHDCVLVLGVEKLCIEDKQRSFRAISTATDIDDTGFEQSKEGGPLTHGGPMDIYAWEARNYMKSYPLTKEHLAKVCVKNHYNGSLNPYAQYGRVMTVEEVLAEPVIVEPLTRAMCCPVSDGGAAAIVCSSKFARKYTSRLISVVTSVIRAGKDLGPDYPVGGQGELSKRIAQQAYELAGIGPSDINVFEVTDATAMGEVLLYEELGICGRGEAPFSIDNGNTELTGHYPVNPSGGLESRGHPFGASGIAQIAELVWQLRGQAGPRQVSPIPKVALAELHGGFIKPENAAGSVTILKL